MDENGVTLKEKLSGMTSEFSYVSGTESLIVGEYVDICALRLEPNSSYMIFISAEIDTSTDARYSLRGLTRPNNAIRTLGPNTVRQTGNSGGGVASHNLVQTGASETRYYIQSYAYGGMPAGVKVNGTLLAFKLRV